MQNKNKQNWLHYPMFVLVKSDKSSANSILIFKIVANEGKLKRPGSTDRCRHSLFIIGNYQSLQKWPVYSTSTIIKESFFRLFCGFCFGGV